MSELFQSITNIQAPFNMIVLVVLIGSAATILTSGFSEVRKYLSHRQDVELKRELLERGMSADEIERVARAGETSSRNRSKS